MVIAVALLGGCVLDPDAPDEAEDLDEIEQEVGVTMTLASGQREPTTIRSDAKRIFWINTIGQQVMKLSRSGGTPKLLRKTFGFPTALAIDSNHVYWAECVGAGYGCEIWKIRKDGTAPRRLATEPGRVTGLATDGSFVYWVGSPSARRVAKTGGSVATLMSGLTQGTTDIVVDDTYVYVADYSGGALYRGAKQGGAQIVLARGAPFSLSLAGQRICFTNYYAPDHPAMPSIRCVKKASGELVLDNAMKPSPRNLFIDEGALYYTRSDAGLLGAAAPNEGWAWSIPVASSRSNSPWDLTVDHNARGRSLVFFTNRSDGTINRLVY